MALDLEKWVVETYRAVFDREALMAQFEKLAQHFSSPYSALHFEGRAGPKLGFTTGVDLNTIAADYPNYRNLWIERGNKQLLTLGVTHDEWHTPVAQMRATDYHRHILKPLDIDHSIGVLCSSKAHERFAMLSFSRHADAGHYDDTSVKQLYRLRPHLEGILLLYQQASATARRVSQLKEMIDQTGLIIFRVDEDLRILDLSRQADERLSHSRDISCNEAGQLCIEPAENQHSLRTGLKTLRAGSSVLRLNHSDPAVLLKVQLLPQSGAFPSSARRQFLLTIQESRFSPEGVSILKKAYQFTSREAELAVELAKTFNLQQAAEKLGMSYETARSHLKRCFEKADVGSQSELVTTVRDLIQWSPSGQLVADF